ncbi:hypothetical protein CEE37_04780 [candidate division LCP-89 bacterium B3_LCP]|uniref:Mut7-C RNAse domain-containing protein n=1 Tax=candidate division LCP-89 bacterium B3_LCP TaxID=2012998 RepID=A0A532V4G1_UNCL8|nr:MAG: hypothetical protein CEE37_04780 [candidate division LCP-89 bacterium B3_LCP]
MSFTGSGEHNVSLATHSFILETELFPLCKALRMLGFDALCRSDLSHRDAIARSIEERRVWVLKSPATPGLHYGIKYFLLETDEVPDQLDEIDEQYTIREGVTYFSRCLKCNLLLTAIPEEKLLNKVPERILQNFNKFQHCTSCKRIYWQGSHLKRMRQKLESWGWREGEAGG